MSPFQLKIRRVTHHTVLAVLLLISLLIFPCIVSAQAKFDENKPIKVGLLNNDTIVDNAGALLN